MKRIAAIALAVCMAAPALAAEESGPVTGIKANGNGAPYAITFTVNSLDYCVSSRSPGIAQVLVTLNTSYSAYQLGVSRPITFQTGLTPHAALSAGDCTAIHVTGIE